MLKIESFGILGFRVSVFCFYLQGLAFLIQDFVVFLVLLIPHAAFRLQASRLWGFPRV